MVLQRVEHEVVIKIVLPEEYLGFLFVGGETHIVSQSFAIHLDISAIYTLQCYLPIPLVDELKLRALALVASMSVVEDTVRVAYCRTTCRFIDDAESLAVRDVPPAIGLGLLHRKVVKFSIAAVLALPVERKEGMT